MRALLPALALLLTLPVLRADEGMWTFDNLPMKQMKEKYGFVPDQAWLDHLRLSSVRLPGGSGSFISADGLVLTNHHVGHDWIQRASTAGNDYVENGFLAADRSKEIQVPGMEAFVLVETKNVTEELAAAMPKSGSEQELAKARKEAMEKVLERERKRTGLDCQPVTLYQGGETWVYAYRKFTDLRLVMAPEYQIAAFGKDWDNFAWTRHDLDFSLFRIYENGKPYHADHHLTWSREGVAFGDMTFTSGHPGRTSRLDSLAQMIFRRRVEVPVTKEVLERTRRILQDFSHRNKDYERELSSDLLFVENSYKVYQGEAAGLANEAAMARIGAAEKELRSKVEADAALKAQAGGAWERIEQVLSEREVAVVEEALLNARFAMLVRGPLEQAMDLVELAEAGVKPGDKRPGMARPLANLLKPGKLDKELETAMLQAGMAFALEKLGPKHEIVVALLDGRTPAEAAKALVEGTRMGDAGLHRQLLAGGFEQLKKNPDPMLRLAQRLLPIQERIAKRMSGHRAVIAEQTARIARARFAVLGKSSYPDATFTLRLSYGKVDTYPWAGTLAQPFTTFGGLYDRADAWGPKAESASWDLPASWRKARKALDPSTPYNFISSNDIIGGNSGSPVVNRKGELVGLAFDGNVESHAGRFYYDEKMNRCLSVDARAILAALDTVYDAKHLVAEILDKK